MHPVCSMGEKGRGYRDKGAFARWVGGGRRGRRRGLFSGARGDGERLHRLFSRVCVGAAKGRGGTAFLPGLALREVREAGAAFSSGPVPGGLEESWGDLSPGSALEEDEEKGGCGLSLEACDGGSQGER